MSDEQYLMVAAHLRAVRTAIVALAFAVLTAAFIVERSHLDFPFLIATILVCLYSFVPPIVQSR